MNPSRRLTRRRVLQIVAGVAGMALTGGSRAGETAKTAVAHTWRGIALGAPASITLCHYDPARARRLLRLCVSEITRLESVFSLYRYDSEIVRLNREGFLGHPSPDLVHLLSRARVFGDVTMGAFDPTVQPLWDLYVRHFGRQGSRRGGPRASAIDKVIPVIDYRSVAVSAGRIEFERHGMSVTLNGIAQGYVTDRVTDLLRNEGFENLLVDLGEIRGLGRRADGRPWTVGLENPVSSTDLVDKLILENKAIASSAGSATRFDENGRHHHLFDPRTGRSTDRYLGVTVIAPTATAADALSTGLASLSIGEAENVLKAFPSVIARLTTDTGDVVTLSG